MKSKYETKCSYLEISAFNLEFYFTLSIFMSSKIKIDIPFFISVVILALAGYLIFSSASLGLLTSSGSIYSSVTWNQTFFGLVLGALACLITSKIPYTLYRKYAFYIF